MLLGNQNICRHAFGNERICPSVQGAVARQDPQRFLRGFWVLSSRDWSALISKARPALWQRADAGWSVLWVLLGTVCTPGFDPEDQNQSPGASYGWNSRATGARIFGLGESGMDAPTFWKSPPDGARAWGIRPQQGGGKIGHRPVFYWIVSVTGVSWSLASQALACNRKHAMLRMRKKEMFLQLEVLGAFTYVLIFLSLSYFVELF